MNPRSAFALLLVLASGCGMFSRPVDLEPPPVHEDPDGLLFVDLAEGAGNPVGEGDRVRVDYEARLIDGVVVDSSYVSGLPADIEIGAGQVIAGWERSLVGMRAGGRRHVEIPPALAYGPDGVEGVIPPDSRLLLEIELLEVLDAAGAEASGEAASSE